MSNKMHVKTGDTVVVLSGKDKGKKGRVLDVMPKAAKVLVEGINMSKKHKKPRRAGEVGGIVKQESPLYACKVMHVCNKCNAPTRVGRKELADGSLVRYCKKCGETFEK